jgi:hypothetical protein
VDVVAVKMEARSVSTVTPVKSVTVILLLGWVVVAEATDVVVTVYATLKTVSVSVILGLGLEK